VSTIHIADTTHRAPLDTYFPHHIAGITRRTPLDTYFLLHVSHITHRISSDTYFPLHIVIATHRTPLDTYFPLHIADTIHRTPKTSASSLPFIHPFSGPSGEVYSSLHTGAIAGVILILAALLLIFLKSRNRNRNQLRAIQYNNIPQKSIFALSSYKQSPQPLPLYTQPTSPYAQHYNGGVPMPQAVHPSTSGYYRQAGQVQQDNGVRFGGVGVVRY
jgi:hypothetical protein